MGVSLENLQNLFSKEILEYAMGQEAKFRIRRGGTFPLSLMMTGLSRGEE